MQRTGVRSNVRRPVSGVSAVVRAVGDPSALPPSPIRDLVMMRPFLLPHPREHTPAGGFVLVMQYQFWYIAAMDEYEVRLLEDALRFLRSLPPKLRTKAYRGIELLETFGPELSMPHARALRNAEGLHELRVKFASDIVRLFYFHHEGKVYIVTSGFVKKSDKTGPRELQRAVRLMHTLKEDAP